METHSLNEFKWTTDLVSECCATLILGKGGITSVQDFIDSKMAVSEPVKEKVEVEIRYHTFGAGLVVIDTNKVISEDKFPAIKKAIEWELNEVENLDKINTGNYISNLNTNDTEKELERGFTIITSKQSPPPFELKEGKDWEIVSYLYDGRIFTKEADGKYTNREDGNDFSTFLTKYEVDKTIHSVKRLSNNTVFKVGDELDFDWKSIYVTGSKKIKSFNIEGNQLYVNGEDFSLILDSAKLLSTPTQQVVEDKPNRCGVCGDNMAVIRGRYPNTDKRQTCPTCVTERLEQINEISNNDYGKSYQSK